MKALGLVVLEKKIFLCPPPPRAGPLWTTGARLAGFYKEDHYILLQIKYESSGPCGFGEEDFFMFYPLPPGRGPYGPQGARLAGFIKRSTIHCY